MMRELECRDKEKYCRNLTVDMADKICSIENYDNPEDHPCRKSCGLCDSDARDMYKDELVAIPNTTVRGRTGPRFSDNLVSDLEECMKYVGEGKCNIKTVFETNVDFDLTSLKPTVTSALLTNKELIIPPIPNDFKFNIMVDVDGGEKCAEFTKCVIETFKSN